MPVKLRQAEEENSYKVSKIKKQLKLRFGAFL